MGTTSNEHSGRTVSVWMETAILPAFPPLIADAHADVCIVGAGIAGLTTAYLLGREKRSVVVLDDGPIGSGETERTTAHLSCVLDARYSELEHLHGEIGARLAAESHAAAIDRIEQTVGREAIKCGFERLDGFLFAPPRGSPDTLERELEAVHRVGLIDTELVARAPLGLFDSGTALRFPRQAQFHPLNYLAGLAQAIVRDGGRIYSRTHASKIEGGEPSRIETRNGPVVTADAIVVATNSPVNDLLAIHTKQASYRTYVIGIELPSGSIEKALYWDTDDPYHYVRLLRADSSTRSENDLLIVGGEDHKTGQEDDAETRYQRLEAWAQARFPMMGDVQFRWSGQVVEPVDGLAFIGRNPMDKPNVFVATGFSGNGMTYGAIAGELLSDLIQGRENAWSSLYEPSRKTLGAAKTFAAETINMAAQYADWLTPGDAEEGAFIAPGSGAVVRRGLSKVAVYRDDDGRIHELSAVCPHLGGIVAWNHSEGTWDCPCHGSRFDKLGKVLNGPANTNLRAATSPDQPIACSAPAQLSSS